MQAHNWNSFFFRLTITVSIEVAFLFLAGIPAIDAMDRYYVVWGYTIGAVVTIIVSIWILYFGIRWSYKGLTKK